MCATIPTTTETATTLSIVVELGHKPATSDALLERQPQLRATLTTIVAVEYDNPRQNLLKSQKT